MDVQRVGLVSWESRSTTGRSPGEVSVGARAAAKTLAQMIEPGGGRYGAVVLEMLHHVLEVIGHPVGGVGPQALDPLVEIVADVRDRPAKHLTQSSAPVSPVRTSSATTS